MDELKPVACPWCGGTEREVHRDPRPQWMTWYVVICTSGDPCGAMGPARRTKAEAIAAWSTRKPDPATLLAVIGKALEAAAGVADEGNVHWRDKAGAAPNKRESRDYETMAIACCHVSAAIKSLDPATILAGLTEAQADGGGV